MHKTKVALTQKFAEPFRLMIVFHSNTESVEKDKDYDEPVEPLLFHCTPNEESGTESKTG